jgi:hypothetical protein
MISRENVMQFVGGQSLEFDVTGLAELDDGVQVSSGAIEQIDGLYFFRCGVQEFLYGFSSYDEMI